MIYFPFEEWTNLGNWMFQYAAAMSIGQEVRGYLESPAALARIERTPDIFRSLRLVDELPCGVREYRQPAFTYEKVPDELCTGDWLIRGFFQSEKYFDRQRVREAFGPSSSRIAELKAHYGEWLAQENVTGIHVRRGDYLTQLYNHPFAGKKYYEEAIRRMEDCRHYIVCSDDIGWCKTFFTVRRFPGRHFYFSEGGSPISDMYLQSMCHNNIISNGTFAWWGAWLNNHPDKRVIAPSHWFGFAKKLDVRDMYWEGMEIIENSYGLVDGAAAYGQFFRKKIVARGSTLKHWILRK